MQKSLSHAGCQLTYRVRGSGAPVLMIQGVGAGGEAWQPQVEGLGRDFTCLTFDNRGMGASQPLVGSLTVAQMADDARALMDAEGWDRAHVVGHSLGGLVAQVLALTHPERVRTLSLLCTFSNGRSVAPLSWRMIWLGLRATIGTRRMRRHGFLNLIYPAAALAGVDREALAARLADLFGHDLGVQPPVAGAQLKALRATDVTPRLAELSRFPTLVVSAAHDPIAPPSLAQVMARSIPGSRYAEFADASHGLPIQWPERVNELLREHFTTAP